MYETIFQLILNTCREARDENSIQDPKSILWAMRKCQLYREGKIRLLHKLTGMEFLNREYVSASTRPDRYKGYHVFQNKSEVEDRFKSGKPLSCFRLDGDCNAVHVAFTRGEPEQRGDEHEVTFLSFRYHTSQMYTHETGMQFCRFECTNEVSSVRKTSLNLLDYALMLPYSKMGFPFQRQFTLVYSDWDVLLCDNNDPDSSKGPVSVHSPLFECDVL